MTLVTLRPDGVLSSTGTSVVGAASIPASLSDDSDSSYTVIPSSSDSWSVSLADSGLSPSVVIKSVSYRLRCALNTASSKNYPLSFTIAGETYGDLGFTVNWTSPTTVTVATTTATTGGAPYTVADVNADYADAVGSGTGVVVQLRTYEAYLDVIYVAKPVVAPSAPTGTVTTTNKPQVAWANTLDSDGGAQTAYEVKIFSAAQYGAGGFDPSVSTPTNASGIKVASAATWQPTDTIADGTYRAYVRVAQTVNGSYHWSDWAYTAFTTLVDLPATPTLVLTPQNADGRIKIDVTDNAGSATTNAIEIQRSIDNASWAPLRITTDTAGITPTPDTTVYDYEAGNGQTVYYRARALHDYSGVYAASAWATASSSWSSSSWWLKCPVSPALNAIINPHAVASFSRRARQGVFQALGASEAIVVSDTRGARSGPITLRLDTDEEIVALDALLDSGEALLLHAPAGHHFPDRYVAIGDLDRARLADKSFIEGTLDSFQWTEVVTPIGVVDAWPTGLAPSESLAPSTSLAPAA